jgi:hypothetical protein
VVAMNKFVERNTGQNDTSQPGINRLVSRVFSESRG